MTQNREQLIQDMARVMDGDTKLSMQYASIWDTEAEDVLTLIEQRYTLTEKSK